MSNFLFQRITFSTYYIINYIIMIFYFFFYNFFILHCLHEWLGICELQCIFQIWKFVNIRNWWSNIMLLTLVCHSFLRNARIWSVCIHVVGFWRTNFLWWLIYYILPIDLFSKCFWLMSCFLLSLIQDCRWLGWYWLRNIRW